MVACGSRDCLQTSESANVNAKWLPSGPRTSGEGVEEQEQGIMQATPGENGGILLKITLLAAGFVIGPSGKSVRQICQQSGADIKSWTHRDKTRSHCKERPCRNFSIQGSQDSVVVALDIMCDAVNRYKELCEGCYCGQYVSQFQRIHDIDFMYHPPPRNVVPHAAALQSLQTRPRGHASPEGNAPQANTIFARVKQAIAAQRHSMAAGPQQSPGLHARQAGQVMPKQADMVQVATAERQCGGHHVGAQAPANTVANAASLLPTAVSASESCLIGGKWQNPYAIMPTTLANASFASVSSSSTSSGHCLGPSGSLPCQGPPSTPATPQSPHSAFNTLVATPQAPKSAFNFPIATPTQPPTAEWGCIRPGHSTSQQLSSAHHDQQSTQAPPLFFSTHQQCRTVPRQTLTPPQQFPSSLEQACLAAQQQHKLLLRPLQQTLNGRQQSPTSSLVASQQLQHTLLRDAPTLSLPRVDGTSSALFDTHHFVSGAHRLYNF